MREYNIIIYLTWKRRTSSIAAPISVARKTSRSYKDDPPSDHVDVFCTERGRKKVYKGFQHFCQECDRKFCGTHLFLLDWYFLPHFTLDNFNNNYSLLEAEYSRRGKYSWISKETKNLNLIDGSNCLFQAMAWIDTLIVIHYVLLLQNVSLNAAHAGA